MAESIFAGAKNRRMAKRGGSRENADEGTAWEVTIMNGERGVPGTPSEADKKLYYYGMAIHVATDAVAHHSFGWQDNAWRHAQHTGSYGWADNPEKFRYRYDYSKHIAYRIVRAYVAGNQASYKTFVPDDTALRNTMLNSVIFKMENITRNAKRVNSSVVSDNEAMTFFNKYNYNYTHNYGSSSK